MLGSRIVDCPAPARRPNRALRWLAAVCAVPLLAILVATVQQSLPYSDVFSDPVAVAKVHPATGAISQLGLLLWAAAGTVAVSAWGLLRAWRTEPELRWFLLVTGLFTGFLMLDDAYLLHETVLPALGLKERYIKVAYLIGILAYVVRFRPHLGGDALPLTLTTGALFAISFMFDTMLLVILMGGVHENHLLIYAVEDGAKVLGIAVWLAFVAKTAYDRLSRPG